MTGLAALVGCLLVFIIGLGIVPFILMLAWNAVVPYIFNGPTLDFWQALALYVLVSLLTSGFQHVTTQRR